MKVGIIAPPRFVEKIRQIIQLDFSEIEPVDCAYTVYTEAVEIIKHRQPHLDAALFGGAMSYILAKEQVTPLIPWEFIPQGGSSLLRALLEASRTKPFDIANVSFDSYLADFLYESYAEIGLSKDKLHIYLAERKPMSAGYLNYVYSLHEHLFRAKKVTGCITALDVVYEKLCANKIPAIMIEHTSSIIRETLKKLRLSHQIQVSRQSQIVSIYIQINTPNDSRLFNYDEYQQVIDKMKIAKQIYLFAKRIQAAVVESGERNYLLFTTKQLLEGETLGLTRISLLEMARENTDSGISIGIGYGNTAQEAKQNAYMGMVAAETNGGNKAYVVYNGKKMVGPIKNTGIDVTCTHNIDDQIQKSAEKAGVSVNTILRLYSIMNERGINMFTPRDLSNCFGVTPRTMNRLIEKLEEAGICTIIGKKAAVTGGRPSRIIQINVG